MLCIIALIFFAFLGIFSATHRALAKEALDCVLRRITLRPCNTGFNEKIKGRIIGKLLNRSVLAARVFNKHFELISWIFIILSLTSAFYVVRGGYNYYLYGSCNGLNQSGFCVFDPVGGNNKVSPVNSGICPIHQDAKKTITLAGLDLTQFPQKIFGSKNQVVFVGCYNCDYSRKTYPLIQKLINKNKADFTFIHIPAKEKTNYVSDYVYCLYKEDQEKFWSFNDNLFASDKKDVESKDYLNQLAGSLGFNMTKLQQCVLSDETKNVVSQQFEQIQATGIYGTPTIFINGEVLVGPKPYRVYERMLKNN
ncbi:MAG: thioredoxin domain-containing protein [Patescibacteria group bacterium]